MNARYVYLYPTLRDFAFLIHTIGQHGKFLHVDNVKKHLKT